MRIFLPAALAASLLVPAAAEACTRCVYHGEARENAAWQVILATASPKTAPVVKAPSPAKPRPAAPPPRAK